MGEVYKFSGMEGERDGEEGREREGKIGINSCLVYL